MRHPLEIENIEAMRRQEGIEDVELRDEIRGLEVGDHVNLTFLPRASAAGETVPVRITSIRGRAYRGKLANAPVSPGLSNLRAGSMVAFTAEHIHSLVKREHVHEH